MRRRDRGYDGRVPESTGDASHADLPSRYTPYRIFGAGVGSPDNRRWCGLKSRALFRDDALRSPPYHSFFSMKTIRLTRVMIAAACGTVVAAAGWGGESGGASGAPTDPAEEEATVVFATAPSGTAAITIAGVSTTVSRLDVASASWLDIKDHSYAMRASFFAELARLEARVGFQIRELTTKRAIMDGNTETKDWDFAMKEMRNARAYLRSMGRELREADETTWAQKKEKVGYAWDKSQNAYSKVRASTTQ